MLKAKLQGIIFLEAFSKTTNQPASTALSTQSAQSYGSLPHPPLKMNSAPFSPTQKKQK
ncbi:hypothetical protein ACHAWX_000312 [Stephanocyclus meneghinianus]